MVEEQVFPSRFRLRQLSSSCGRANAKASRGGVTVRSLVPESLRGALLFISPDRLDETCLDWFTYTVRDEHFCVSTADVFASSRSGFLGAAIVCACRLLLDRSH